MAKPILFMHMGFPKTGTSTIQEFLYQNRLELLQTGICYPAPLQGIVLTDVQEHGHAHACVTLEKANMSVYGWQWAREHFCAEMKAAGTTVNILSSENFVFEHSDHIAWYLNDFEVKGIYYFRNLFDYLLSLQKTFIRNCLRPDVFTFEYFRNIRILACLRHHMRVLGRDHCFFRDFDHVKPRLLEDFNGIVGMGGLDGFSKVENVNVTPGDAVHAFLYHLSFLPLGYAQYKILKRDLYGMDLEQFAWYKFNALPDAVYELDDYAKRAIKMQGELLQDVDWYDKTLVRRDALKSIPYQNLPTAVQYYIYERLSPESQNILRQWLDIYDGNTPFLPDMTNVDSWKIHVLPFYNNHSALAKRSILEEGRKRLLANQSEK